MGKSYKLAAAVIGALFATQAAAEVVFYERENFEGRTLTAKGTMNNFERTGFNDQASSAVVYGSNWEVCEHAGFQGNCRVLRPGRYPSLNAVGMGNTISSVRSVRAVSGQVEPSRYVAPAYPVYDARRRRDERIFEADVTAVRAVYAQPEQRCWVEREQVSGGSGDRNVGGAIIGGILGGVLGHQIGGGRGQDVATALGAVGGAAVGSNVGRSGNGGYTQDVKRCSTTTPTSGRPDYWDVTYNFKGQDHRVQMASPPGRTVTVNGRGEPREG